MGHSCSKGDDCKHIFPKNIMITKQDYITLKYDEKKDKGKSKKRNPKKKIRRRKSKKHR